MWLSSCCFSFYPGTCVLVIDGVSSRSLDLSLVCALTSLHSSFLFSASFSSENLLSPLIDKVNLNRVCFPWLRCFTFSSTPSEKSVPSIRSALDLTYRLFFCSCFNRRLKKGYKDIENHVSSFYRKWNLFFSSIRTNRIRRAEKKTARWFDEFGRRICASIDRLFVDLFWKSFFARQIDWRR